MKSYLTSSTATNDKFQSQMGKAEDYFNKEKRVLKVFGISFTGNESIAYKVYSFVFIFSTNFIYPILDIHEVFKNDIDVVADILIYVFATSVALIKTVVVLKNRITFGKILSRLEKRPFTVDLERGGEVEEVLVNECVWITGLQSLVYWMLSAFTIACTVSYSLVIRIRCNDPTAWELPYGPMSILNTSSSPNYEIMWLYQNLSIISVVSHFTTIDLLMAAVLAHISYQFKILQNSIKRITFCSYRDRCKEKYSSTEIVPRTITEVDVSAITWKLLHKHLKKIVHYHWAILDIAAEMEFVFSELLLLVFLGTLGILCFLIYRSSLMENHIAILRYLGEAFSASFQVLTICYWGEQVVFESQRVGQAAYEANFVGTDARFQKVLALIIRRSQNPTKLTAAKFTNICLSTFAWIMRTSYSAFMVLRNSSGN